MSARVSQWQHRRAAQRLILTAALLIAGGSLVGTATAAPVAQQCPSTSPFPTAFMVAASNSSLDIGCMVGAPFSTPGSEQPFENGTMLWLREWGSVTILNAGGTYEAYNDQYSVDKPEALGLTPPLPGLLEPRQGFGAIWRKIGGPTAQLGWAIGPETSYVASVQYFERGAVILRGDLGIYVLAIFNHTRGTWSPKSNTGF